MFSNSGKALKVLAYVFFVLGIISSLTIAITYFVNEQVEYGIGYLLGGILGAYLIGVILYAFGDIVENVYFSRVRLKRIENEIKNAKQEIINLKQSNDQTNDNNI